MICDKGAYSKLGAPLEIYVSSKLSLLKEAIEYTVIFFVYFSSITLKNNRFSSDMKEHKHPRPIVRFIPPKLRSLICRQAAHDQLVIVPMDTRNGMPGNNNTLVETAFYCLLAFCGGKLQTFSEKFLLNFPLDISHSKLR